MLVLHTGLALMVASPMPAPPPGQWSSAHPNNWCNDQASLVKDLGKGVDLTVCKAACVAAAACGYVSHADQTDLRCMLYSNCSTPMCSPHPRESGWFTTYQYGRPGSQSWTECIPTPSPPPPPPPPPPPSSSMTVRVVNSAIVKKHGAKCLDGTPPAYKIRQGSGENASKFIFFMEGGGWCFSPKDCEKRRGGGLGSSNSYKNGTYKNDLGGVMAHDPLVNPDFHSYTMVFAHYCDGTSFSSYRPLPVQTSTGEDMWFRGQACLAAILEELQILQHVDKATEFIVSGGSAGGLAVYYHLDSIAETVTAMSPTARVSGFPDAGYFADLPSMTGEYAYRGYYQDADSSCWNTTASYGTNDACMRANIAGNTTWKCLMAEYLTDYIETPMFVMNAAFDVYQMQNILDVGCVPRNCSAVQIAAIEKYRLQYISSSIGHLVARAPKVGHGAYIDSCLVHEQNVDYCSGGNAHAYNCVGWLTTKIGGVSPQQAYSAWYFANSGKGGRAAITIDTASTVEPASGSNPTCPWRF